MKELFNVQFHYDGSFEMRLVNGVIRVPGEYGCYVLSTGCGTGKTECCKSIIRQCFHQGILYCVDTIAELDKMYEWIMIERDSIGIAQDDVMIISSDPKHEWFLRQYQNNPEILMTKKVVLITHARFWTDLINYFLIYQPQYRVDPFDGNFQSLMSRPDLRQFIIFDETPKFIQPFFEMPRAILGAFAQKNVLDQWECLPAPDIREKYHHFIKNTDPDPFPKSDPRISRIKRDVIFNLIPQYFGRWSNSAAKKTKITFTPLNLAQHQVNTRIMILEGAGDVLFQGSQYYRLLDIKHKYNCQISFQQFPFAIKRREVLDMKDYDDFLSFVTNRIEGNQKYGIKTLVVVWKNQGEKSATYKAQEDSKDSEYYMKIKTNLAQEPILCGGMYDVIYYGSAESKSTNQYRDYREIILAGDWHLTNSETSKFNNHFGVNMDTGNHKLWAFIQLLSRIGIRLHDGQMYSVCYSSDFSQDFISKLNDYLIYDVIPSNQVANGDPKWLQDIFEKTKTRSNFKDEIKILFQYDPMIAEHLRRNEKYNLNITLDDIYKIIPKDRKKKERYKTLIMTLEKLGVTMKITS